MSGARDPREHLEQFFDGTLPEELKRDVQDAARADADLRDELVRQARVDRALRRVFPIPSDDRVAEILAAAQAAPRDAASRPPVKLNWFMRLSGVARAAAITLVVGGVGTGAYLYYVASQQVVIRPMEMPKLIPLAAAFEGKVAGGFKHDFECKNDLEFAAATWRQTDQQMVLPAELPADVKLLGWARVRCMSYSTLMLLTRIDDQNVAVFMDRKGNADKAGAPPTGMKLHRRDFGTAVLFEMSPFDQPRLLDKFVDPQIPTEKLNEVPGW